MNPKIGLSPSLYTRLALIYLTATSLLPGAWALFFPHSFYTSFPGFGHVWVAIDGPYNEHLVRDVGAFFLAITTLSSIALVSPRLVSSQAVGLCTLVFNSPHLLYHLGHLHMLPVFDQVANVVTLSMGVLVSASLLLSPRQKG